MCKECVHDFQVILYMSILYNASNPTCFIQITLGTSWIQFTWKSNRLRCYLFLSIVLHFFSTQQLTPFRTIHIQDIFDHTSCCWNVLRKCIHYFNLFCRHTQRPFPVFSALLTLMNLMFTRKASSDIILQHNSLKFSRTFKRKIF